jgi:hypothetical protein
VGWAWPHCNQRLDELMDRTPFTQCLQGVWEDGRCLYHAKIARGLTCTHLGTLRKANNHARKDLTASAVLELVG